MSLFDPARPELPDCFVTDSSLDYLARRLRLLGYDVLTLHGARLEELFEAARRERRTVLSLSTRHPRRYADVPLRSVPRGEPQQAVREIAARCRPAGQPFSRCPRCNQALQRREPIEARGEVPGRVLRSARRFTFCPNCGKWYWEGSHVARLKAWFEAALGRPLDGGPTEPPAKG
ncbi:MAG TPA: Mut7-C RNAse domain-containing protein [Candidatus Eisenbacteria bacterium]|jgi:hypothetical protein